MLPLHYHYSGEEEVKPGDVRTRKRVGADKATATGATTCATGNVENEEAGQRGQGDGDGRDGVCDRQRRGRVARR
jgi:hypothetical protein